MKGLKSVMLVFHPRVRSKSLIIEEVDLASDLVAGFACREA